MYNNHKKGLRCHICTGCGRCPGIYPDSARTGERNGLHVLTEGMGEGETGDVLKRDLGNLITADIGTTTIAMVLYGEDGRKMDSFVCLNPQIKYGADVISRIQAAEDPRSASEMKLQVRQALCRGIGQFRERISGKEGLRMVIAANTTMVYLFMGWDTKELGEAPFRASRLEAVRTELDGVACYIFPGLSAFVGGDITAGIYACGMTDREEPTLLIDLGTNGEMALGSRSRVLACATAAGPAFEGGVNRGVWGSDMVSLLARLRREGVLDETGLLADPFFDTGIRIGDVCVTQQSVRAVQLAKGAIAAGIRILAEAYGLSPDRIPRVVLAGGFGYYLNPEDAACIGLLPGELAGRTFAGGNTALAGARLVGMRFADSEAWISGAENIFPKGCSVEIKNLAKEPDFEKWYLESMDMRPLS